MLTGSVGTLPWKEFVKLWHRVHDSPDLSKGLAHIAALLDNKPDRATLDVGTVPAEIARKKFHDLRALPV